MAQPQMHYPTPPNIHPPRTQQQTNGPAKLWPLQGMSSPIADPTSPNGITNGISTDFAQPPSAPKTPRTPGGVGVPSRESNLAEVGFPHWTGVLDGLLRKLGDEVHYGNYLGTDSSTDGSSRIHAQAAVEILDGCLAHHLPAFKSFLHQSLRSAPSLQPSSPNPVAITSPIPPLSQQVLLSQLIPFLSSTLLPSQLQQLIHVINGQTHFILGQILRGVGFPVQTHVLGNKQSGGGCDLRLLDSVFQARVFLFRTAALATSHQGGKPIFYLSPSHANTLGFPETLPRYCFELNLPASSFKTLPLMPTMDEALLSQVARSSGKLDPAVDELDGQTNDMPNPFLTYQLDAQSLEADILSDLAAAEQAGAGASRPCAIFATLGNTPGVDLPFEYDNIEELSQIAIKYHLSLHAEGTTLFATDPKLQHSGNGHSAPNQSSNHITSTLFDSVDSILVTPGSWLGVAGTQTLIAFCNPEFLAEPLLSKRRSFGFHQLGVDAVARKSPSLLSLHTSTPVEFSALFALWFNLLQINPASFPSLLTRLHLKQIEKIQNLKRMIYVQTFPSFISPAGELEEERVAYGTELQRLNLNHWLPPAIPTHAHTFFYFSLPTPYQPKHFNMSLESLNAYLANRISQRIQLKQGDYLSYSRLFGLHLMPVQHFDRIGFIYTPQPVTIWTSDNQVIEEESCFAKLLIEVIQDEINMIVKTGQLRQEFEELIQSEGVEFVYVPYDQIETSHAVVNGEVASVGPIGLGAIKYLPCQVPEHHAAEIGALLNDQLEKLPSSMHLVSLSDAHLSTPAGGRMVSMYRAGKTIAVNDTPSAVCTILELSELPIRKGIREILNELKVTAAKLVYPAHIVDDLNDTLRQGIKAAQEKLVEKSVDAYRPTNLMRWIPVVGTVLNYLAPAEPDNGQQFDIKRRELSSLKYSYANKSDAVNVTPSSRKQSSAGMTPISGTAPTTPSIHPTPSQPTQTKSSTAPTTEKKLDHQRPSVSGTAPVSTPVATTPAPASTVAASRPSSSQPPVASQPTPSQATIPSQPSTTPTSQQPPPPPQQPKQAAPPGAIDSNNIQRTIPPVKITLDEADKVFVDYLNDAPRSLQPDQLRLLTMGGLFQAYFPNQPEDGSELTSPPSTSVTKLFLFLEPNYLPTHEEAIELGVNEGDPVALLCWCEPNSRYVKTDQAVAVSQVNALHLGSNELFPRQSVRGHCFSLVTQHVALHLEAESPAKRKAWFLALYTLVSQIPNHPSASQQQLQTDNSVSPASSTSSSSTTPQLSEAEEERALQAARSFLEKGNNFTVYVLDKNDIELTTTHAVVLWYRPAIPGTNTPHSLCWCRRGGTLDYSPSRSLPLNRTVQICLSKQTKAFKNAAAANCEPTAAFSVMVEKMILNLEAESPDARAKWLSCFHHVMSASGKKRVYDEEPSPKSATNTQPTQ